MLSGIPHAADEATMMHIDEGVDADEMPRRRQELADAHVHLKNTRIMLSDGEFINLHGGFWREKRAAVDGYWLGQPKV